MNEQREQTLAMQPVDEVEAQVGPAVADSLADAVAAARANLAAVYEREADRLFRLAYRLTGNSADADDCLQDCYIEALSKAVALDNPAAFLYRAVRQQGINVIAKRDRRNDAPLNEAIDGYTPAESAKLHVAWVMKHCPKGDRALLSAILKHDGLSSAAEVLNMDRKTIWSALARVRKALGVKLGYLPRLNRAADAGHERRRTVTRGSAFALWTLLNAWENGSASIGPWTEGQ